MSQLVACIALLEIIVNIECTKQKSVNLELETVLAFDKKDNAADIKLIDDVQDFLSIVRSAVSKPKSARRSFNSGEPIKFTDFVKQLIDVLKTYTNDDLEDIFAVIDDEIRKYHYKGCKFHELFENQDMRRFVAGKLKLMKEKPARTIRENLDKTLKTLENAKYYTRQNELIDYINSLYGKNDAEQFNNIIDMFKQYNGKYKRTDTDLIRMVRNGLRTVLFDHYSRLNTNTRTDFKIKLETYWKDFSYRDGNHKVWSITYNKNQLQPNEEDTNQKYVNEQERAESVEDSLNESTPLHKKIYQSIVKTINNPLEASDEEAISNERIIEDSIEIHKKVLKKKKTTPMFISLENQGFITHKTVDDSVRFTTRKQKSFITLYPEEIKLNTKKKSHRMAYSTKRPKIQTLWPETVKHKKQYRAKSPEYVITKNLDLEIQVERQKPNNKYRIKLNNKNRKESEREPRETNRKPSKHSKSQEDGKQHDPSELTENEDREKVSSKLINNKLNKYLRARIMAEDTSTQLKFHLRSENKDRHKPKTHKRHKYNKESTEEGVDEGMSIASYENRHRPKNSLRKNFDIELVDQRSTGTSKKATVKYSPYYTRTRYPKLEFWEGTEKSTRSTGVVTQEKEIIETTLPATTHSTHPEAKTEDTTHSAVSATRKAFDNQLLQLSTKITSTVASSTTESITSTTNKSDSTTNITTKSEPTSTTIVSTDTETPSTRKTVNPITTYPSFKTSISRNVTRKLDKDHSVEDTTQEVTTKVRTTTTAKIVKRLNAHPTKHLTKDYIPNNSPHARYDKNHHVTIDIWKNADANIRATPNFRNYKHTTNSGHEFGYKPRADTMKPFLNPNDRNDGITRNIKHDEFPPGIEDIDPKNQQNLPENLEKDEKIPNDIIEKDIHEILEKYGFTPAETKLNVNDFMKNSDVGTGKDHNKVIAERMKKDLDLIFKTPILRRSGGGADVPAETELPDPFQDLKDVP